MQFYRLLNNFFGIDQGIVLLSVQKEYGNAEEGGADKVFHVLCVIKPEEDNAEFA